MCLTVLGELRRLMWQQASLACSALPKHRQSAPQMKEV